MPSLSDAGRIQIGTRSPQDHRSISDSVVSHVGQANRFQLSLRGKLHRWTIRVDKEPKSIEKCSKGSKNARRGRLDTFIPPLAGDLSGLPRTYILTGALDLFVDENIEYASRLLRSGANVDLTRVCRRSPWI